MIAWENTLQRFEMGLIDQKIRKLNPKTAEYNRKPLKYFTVKWEKLSRYRLTQKETDRQIVWIGVLKHNWTKITQEA